VIFVLRKSKPSALKTGCRRQIGEGNYFLRLSGFGADAVYMPLAGHLLTASPALSINKLASLKCLSWHQAPAEKAGLKYAPSKPWSKLLFLIVVSE